GREMSDALAALARLRKLSYVDPHRVAVIGHSFGGSLTGLMTERHPRSEPQSSSRVRATVGIGRQNSEHACSGRLIAPRFHCSSYTPQTTIPRILAKRWMPNW